jgi:hypothetical protein
MPTEKEVQGTPIQRPIRNEANDIVGRTDGYIVEASRVTLLVEGSGAADFVAKIHALLDEGKVPEIRAADLKPDGVIRLVRGEKGSTLRIEGRGEPITLDRPVADRLLPRAP